MKIEVLTLDKKPAGALDLKKEIFELAPRADILARAVNWQLAKRRAGTHSTKTISEISGTTKKPFAQKGTGRARQGSLRSPQMRGGAVMFGPTPRDHGYSLPKKIRALALKMALSSKAADGKLVVLDTEKVASPKTKDLKSKLDAFGFGKVLFIGGAELDGNFMLALGNIADADALPTIGANVYDILNHETLVLTMGAVDGLIKRLEA
jgi:large subunit ribosomal protein L4